MVCYFTAVLNNGFVERRRLQLPDIHHITYGALTQVEIYPDQSHLAISLFLLVTHVSLHTEQIVETANERLYFTGYHTHVGPSLTAQQSESVNLCHLVAHSSFEKNLQV